jgi:hypothetical protein
MDKAELAIKKFKERAQKKNIKTKQASEIEKCATQVFASPEGKRVLLWLMEECSFQKTNIACLNTRGELSIRNMVWNESRRDLYLRIRGLLKTRPDVLEAVEVRKLGELNADGNDNG